MPPRPMTRTISYLCTIRPTSDSSSGGGSEARLSGLVDMGDRAAGAARERRATERWTAVAGESFRSRSAEERFRVDREGASPLASLTPGRRGVHVGPAPHSPPRKKPQQPFFRSHASPNSWHSETDLPSIRHWQ